MKNQRPRFPSHRPVLPSLFPSFFLVSSGFPPLAHGCARRDRKKKKERKKERKKEERERKKSGERGRVIEMRDQGAGGAKQRQTALVGGVNQ